MAGGARQLTLDLTYPGSFSREDFLRSPANAAALAAVDSWPEWPTRVLALVGPQGSGKSHLSAIWAARAGARFLSARALASSDVPDALATGALVLEDAAPGAVDERALFHLINLVREEEGHLLLTAATAPGGWRLTTADLASRLRAVPVATLAPPDDALLRAVLVKLFADRQLMVDESVIAFLAHRIERSFAGAKLAVERLDAEALRRQRPVTRALAAEVLRAEE